MKKHFNCKSLTLERQLCRSCTYVIQCVYGSNTSLMVVKGLREDRRTDLMHYYHLYPLVNSVFSLIEFRRYRPLKYVMFDLISFAKVSFVERESKKPSLTDLCIAQFFCVIFKMTLSFFFFFFLNSHGRVMGMQTIDSKAWVIINVILPPGFGHFIYLNLSKKKSMGNVWIFSSTGIHAVL